MARQPFWTGELKLVSDSVGFYTDFLERMDTQAQCVKLKMRAQDDGMACDRAKAEIGIYDFTSDVIRLSRKAGYADAMLVCPNLWLSISFMLTELRRPVMIDPVDTTSLPLRRGLLFVDIRQHTGNVLFVKSSAHMNDEYILMATPTCGESVVPSLWTHNYARD